MEFQLLTVGTDGVPAVYLKEQMGFQLFPVGTERVPAVYLWEQMDRLGSRCSSSSCCPESRT